MAHEENINVIKHNDIASEEQGSIQQKLIDANNEIADLKMQIAWLERSYE